MGSSFRWNDGEVVRCHEIAKRYELGSRLSPG